MFHLDDDMVDMITAGQVFDVEVEESEENPGKQVLVLIDFFIRLIRKNFSSFQDITLKEVDK